MSPAETRELSEVLAGKMWERTHDGTWPGDADDEVAAIYRDDADAALAAIEASGTHCIVPLEPMQEQQISGVEAMAKALEPFIAKLRAEGRESDAITLSVISSGHITGPVYRAALAARPRDVAPTSPDAEHK